MFPFSNNLMNQYMAELYNSVGNANNFYYAMPDNSFPVWNPIVYPEQIENIQIIPPQEEQEVKKEPPTEANPKAAKPKNKEKADSDVILSSEEESPEMARTQGLKQKYGRNIHSNIFNQMIKTIKQDKSFSQKLAQIISMNEANINEKQFWAMFSRKTSKLRIYIGLRTMQNYWKGHTRTLKMGGLKQRKEQEFTMIFRILSRVYLKQYHLCYVYNVLKLQPESKRLHIQATAQMLNAIK